MHKHLHRLERIHPSQPLYSITTCTHDRQPILGNPVIANILVREWQDAHKRHGWGIGRYVIMPDHVHFFCAVLPLGGSQSVKELSMFMGQWKEWTAKAMVRQGLITPIWQEGFFDHVLRSKESYAEKWSYVRENPVRQGLVARWEDWLYQRAVDFDAPL